MEHRSELRLTRRPLLGAAAMLTLGIARQAQRASLAAAQDMPESTKIGNPAIPHITTTDKGTINLYSSWPLSGAYAQICGDLVAAIQMCLDDYGNAAGGYAIKYIPLDDGIAANNGGWDAATESKNVNIVLNDPDAMVFIGPLDSGAAKVAIPILNAASMPIITCVATYPGLTTEIPGVTEQGEPGIYYPTGKRNFMRNSPADDVQGVAAANWALTELGARRAYVLHDQGLYGKGVAEVFEQAFAAGGGEILGSEGYDRHAFDYQALVSAIASRDPDLVYCGASVVGNAGKLLLDMRSVMDDDVVFLGPDGLMTETFLQGADWAAEGAYITFAGYAPDELLRQGGPGADFVARFTELRHRAPDSFITYAYEMTAVIIQAIDQVGEKDRAKILDAMMATENFHGLLGDTWSFTDTGDTDSSIFSLSQVQDGVLTFQQTISSEPAS